MEKQTGKPETRKRPVSREDRLKDALKANLRRRKAQALARSEARATTGKT